MRLKMLVGLALLGVVALPAAAHERPNEGRDMMRRLGAGGLEGKALADAVARAERSPLGSKDNPVRENMPQGERAYLARLRCPDGKAPEAERKGNVGVGVYGNIVDLFEVSCRGAKRVQVYMDMYHDGPELRPLSGFTMAPDDA